MPQVYVGIGSNVDRERNVPSAVRALRARFGEVAVSRVYASAPVGFDGDEFYNLVAGFRTELPLAQLIEALDAIEFAHGRAPDAPRFAARGLDIDLLLYGDAVVDEPGLRLPRGDIEHYPFVLRPLAELAPGLRHPRLGVRLDALWRDFAGDRDGIRPVDIAL